MAASHGGCGLSADEARGAGLATMLNAVLEAAVSPGETATRV